MGSCTKADGGGRSAAGAGRCSRWHHVSPDQIIKSNHHERRASSRATAAAPAASRPSPRVRPPSARRSRRRSSAPPAARPLQSNRQIESRPAALQAKSMNRIESRTRGQLHEGALVDLRHRVAAAAVIRRRRPGRFDLQGRGALIWRLGANHAFIKALMLPAFVNRKFANFSMF